MPTDRLTLQFHVMHQFRQRGIEPTPEELHRAIIQIEQREQADERKYMPMGERLYRDPEIGKKASAGFLDRLIYNFKVQGINMTAGTKGFWNSLSDSEKSTEASRLAREHAKDQINELYVNDPKIQAYLAWKEDEQSWDAGMAGISRAMSEIIPSLASTVAGVVAGAATGSLIGGPAGAVAGTMASLLPMFVMEGTNEWNEAMDIMVDEMGIDPETAGDYANIAALSYGTISSVLERLGARAMFSNVPGLKKLVPERKLLKSLTQKLVNKGVNKTWVRKQGSKAAARLTNILESVMSEGGTEYAQAITQGLHNEALRRDFKDVGDFLRTIKTEMQDVSTLEEGFAGGVMGIPFGFFGLPSASGNMTQQQTKKIIDEGKKEYRRRIETEPIEASNSLEDYFNALTDPQQFGDFDFDQHRNSDDPISKNIIKNEGQESNGAKILSLMKDNPDTIEQINNLENTEVKDKLLKLASDTLNREDGGSQQINVNDVEQMLNALRNFSQKGNIEFAEEEGEGIETETPTPNITWKPDEWIDEEWSPELEEIQAGEYEDETEQKVPVTKKDIKEQKVPKKIGKKKGKIFEDTEKKAEDYLDIPNRVKFPPAKSRKEAHAIVDGKKVSLTEEQKDRIESITKRKGSAVLKEQGEAEADLYTLGGELIAQQKEPTARTIPYTPKGKKEQRYTIEGKGKAVKILDAKGKEVFKKEGTPDRNKILANLAVKEGRANVIEHKGKKYVVNDKNLIMSTATGKFLSPKNKDAKAILAKSKKITPKKTPVKKAPAKKKGTLSAEEILAAQEEKVVDVKPRPGAKYNEDIPPTSMVIGGVRYRFKKGYGIDKLAMPKEGQEAWEREDAERLQEDIEKQKGIEAQKKLLAERKKKAEKKAAPKKKGKLDKRSLDTISRLVISKQKRTPKDFRKWISALVKKQSKQDKVDLPTAYDNFKVQIEGYLTDPFIKKDAGGILDSIIEDILAEADKASQKAAPKKKVTTTKSGIKVWKKFGKFNYKSFAKTIKDKGRRSFGWVAAWFGDIGYTYSGITHDMQTMPAQFKSLARKIEKELGIEEGYFNSALANVFPPGVGISAHADDESIFVRENGTIGKVATISIGGSTGITITNKQTGAFIETITVDEGDLYLMPGQKFQLERKHAVGKAGQERISITFRHIPAHILKEETSDEAVNEELDKSLDESGGSWVEGLWVSDSETGGGKVITDDSNVTGEEDDTNSYQEKANATLPKAHTNKQLTNKILTRLQKMFPFVKIATVEGLIQENGVTAVGKAVGNLVVWSKTDATMDTFPHEFAHIYVAMLRDTPLVKRGIKIAESEEKLVQAMGEYFVNRMDNTSFFKKIKIWLRQFLNKIKNIFSEVPDSDVIKYLAEEFYMGNYIGPVNARYDKYAMYQTAESVDEDGVATGDEIESTNNIPSDVFLTDFFSKVLGVHVAKEHYMRGFDINDDVAKFGIGDLARSAKSFREFADNLTTWAKAYKDTASYRENIRTDFSEERLPGAEYNRLLLLYLQERSKIPRYDDANPEKQGKHTRVFFEYLIPVGKKMKGFVRELNIAPPSRRDNNMQESENYIMNFNEEDIAMGIHDNKIMFMRTHDILYQAKSDKSQREDGLIWWGANQKIDNEFIRHIDDALARSYIKRVIKGFKNNTQMRFLIGAKPGRSSGLFMGSVPKLHTGASPITESAYNQYWEDEFSKGNITEAQKNTLQAKALSVKTNESEDIDYGFSVKNVQSHAWFQKLIMDEYAEKGESYNDALTRAIQEYQLPTLLASLEMQRTVGIHEYFKTIYHNKWARYEKHILDTYNRLGITMAEGITTEGAGDSQIMVVPTDTVIKYNIARKIKRSATDRIFQKIFGDRFEITDVGIMDDLDGATLSGSGWFRRVGGLIGTESVKVLKTVIRSRSTDGNDFLGMKHLQVSLDEGIEFYKPGEATPFAWAEADIDTGLTHIVTKDGKKFEHIASTNEAKMRAGKFGDPTVPKDHENSGFYKLNTISDKDIKVLKNPVKTKQTAAHPMALGEIILDLALLKNNKAAANLHKEIVKHYQTLKDQYLLDLIEMRRNPKKLLGAIKRYREENRIPEEGDMYVEMLDKQDGEGIHHKSAVSMYTSMLNNSYFKNGLLKGKQKGTGHATQLYIKPAMQLPIKDGKEMMASSDNTLVLNQVKIAFSKTGPSQLRFRDSKKRLHIPKTDAEHLRATNQLFKITPYSEMIEDLNNFLLSEDVNVSVDALIHRQPIAKVTGVITRKLTGLVEEQGQVIYLGKKDVKRVLDGDWDGDTAFMEFLPPALLKAYKKWQATTGPDSFESKNMEVALTYFGNPVETEQSNVSALNKEDALNVMTQIARHDGSQGRVTNLKNILAALAYKEISFSGRFQSPAQKLMEEKGARDKEGKLIAEPWEELQEGHSIKTIPLGQKVTLKWMPIKAKNFIEDTTLWDTLMRNGEVLVDTKGAEVKSLEELNPRKKYYLKTTKEHEFAILLQMAVDDKKWGLLSKIDYQDADMAMKEIKGWGMNFPIELMFYRTDGKELTEGMKDMLRIVVKAQNFSSLRQGRSVKKENLSMADLIAESKKLFTSYFDFTAKTGRVRKRTKAQIGDEFLRRMHAEAAEEFYGGGIPMPENIEMNGNVTPSEDLIMGIGKSHLSLTQEVSETKEGLRFMGDGFIDWSDEGYKLAHVNALIEIVKDSKFDDLVDLAKGVQISEADVAEAYTFMSADRIEVLDPLTEKPSGKKTSVFDKFFELYDIISSQKKREVGHVSEDFNKLMVAFVADHADEFLSMSEGAQVSSTALFLLGAHTDKIKIIRLFPMKLMNQKLLGPYMKIFSNKLHNLEKEMKLEKSGKLKRKLRGVRTFLEEAQDTWEDAGEHTELRLCRG